MVHRVAPPVGALEWLADGGEFWIAVGLHSCFVAPGVVLRFGTWMVPHHDRCGSTASTYKPAIYEAPKKGGRHRRVSSVLEDSFIDLFFSCFFQTFFAVTQLAAVHLDLRNGFIFLSYTYVPPFYRLILVLGLIALMLFACCFQCTCRHETCISSCTDSFPRHGSDVLRRLGAS